MDAANRRVKVECAQEAAFKTYAIAAQAPVEYFGY